MGFLLTLLLSIVFGVLGVVRPRVATYLILALFILFDELGPGFTTYRGSWVFNGFFVGFFGLRLIEVLTVSAWIPMLIMAKSRGEALLPFKPERILMWLFFAWIAVLMAVEYGISKKPTVSDWRLIVTGAMQFHMLALMFRNTEDLARLLRVFLLLMGVKALYGLGMYAAGMGVMTPRGRLPFFWDSRQVEAFGLAAVILTGYLINFSSIDPKHRVMPSWLATVILLLLLGAVAGSIRRTVWVLTMLGMLGVLVASRRTTIVHYIAVLMASATLVAGVLLAPGLEKFRDHMGRYVESMNLLDFSQRSRNIENDVHVNNLTSYYKMVTEKTDILALGVHGPSGVHYYDILLGAYSEGGYRLGMAHNGALRSVLFFGVLGLVFYLTFFAPSLARTWRVQQQAPDDHFVKHAAVACGIYLLLQFAAAMAFVPPFYTSSKGLYYTFFQLFCIGMVAWEFARSRRPATAMAVGQARPLNPMPGLAR